MQEVTTYFGANADVRAILSTLATGAQHISGMLQEVNRASAGTTNSSGEAQLALDVEADKHFFSLFWEKRLVREYASEERETIVPVNPQATYSVTIDPLDGSSLLDVNLSVGTILGIWKGSVLTGELVAAAYIVYGPTTVMVCSAGNGVHEFLVTPAGLRLLQEHIQLDEKGKIYSAGGLRAKWTNEHKNYIHDLENSGYKLRYSGGLVPDMHQILLKKGGIFSYPALVDKPAGKLRLLFELCPFSFLIEHAGGSATNGTIRILDVARTELHQRCPIYIGSTQEVALAATYLGSATPEMNKEQLHDSQGGDSMQQYMQEAPMLKKMKEEDVRVPADVPTSMRATYVKNYLDATKATGRLFLFAGDQKIEHLNDDFYGTIKSGPIPLDDAKPEHLFQIAQQAKQHIGFFAAQYGLVARYGADYSDVPYLVKMNSKTNLLKTKDRDPVSLQLVSFDDVLALKENSRLNIVGVGYTIYLGSRFEHKMLAEAGRLIAQAHRHGMLVVLWMYPRGSAVVDEKDPHLIAGAAGVAACLGADFAKVNWPKSEGVDIPTAFQEAVLAAGRTGIITSGGSSTDVRGFLDRLHKQLHVSSAVGNATGRNIHQKSLNDALRMCAAVAALTYENKDVDTAMRIYNGEVQ